MMYKLIKTNRKSLCIQVTDENVIVRAPKRASKREVEAFLQEHSSWIERKQAEIKAAKKEADLEGKLSSADIVSLTEKAGFIVEPLVRKYGAKLGVDVRRLTVRNQRTRWGSCSKDGNVSINCLLMLAPPKVLESVVAHELCHLKHMNHSNRFYAEVEKVFPEYRECSAWLKKNGGVLMRRMGADVKAISRRIF